MVILDDLFDGGEERALVGDIHPPDIDRIFQSRGIQGVVEAAASRRIAHGRYDFVSAFCEFNGGKETEAAGAARYKGDFAVHGWLNLYHALKRSEEEGIQSSKSVRPQLALPALFLQPQEPHVHLVHSIDIFAQDGLVGVLVDVVIVMATFEVSDDLVQFVDLGVHDSQVSNKPHLVHIEPAL
jgi:hypothetical protein